MVTQWTIRAGSLAFGRLPLLMGIVNVTPDSFSDGGLYLDHGAAIDHGLRLAAEGADLLDVGGESTRPGADGVDADEELRRVLPVIRGLCRQTPLPLSVDTSKPRVAREALAVGARIINDVTALEGDPEMVRVAAESGAGVCVMHMQGTPRTMQEHPTYHDVVREVAAFLRRRRDALAAAGIPADRVAVDPGIGFGKTVEHNLTLLGNAWQLHELGCPVLVGHSRKSFIEKVLAEAAGGGERERGLGIGDWGLERRDPMGTSDVQHPIPNPQSPIPNPPPPINVLTAGTIGVAIALARQGVQILRVHDVAPVRQALALFDSVGGLSGIIRSPSNLA